MAYADDLIIVTETLRDMDRVLRVVEAELDYIGLTVNSKKSHVMLQKKTTSTSTSTSISTYISTYIP